MRRFAVLLIPFALTGCCMPFSDCSDPELVLTQQQATTYAKPANVTVSFKVDDESGNGIPGLTTAQFDIFEDETLVSTFEAKPVILPRPGSFSNYTVVLLDLSGSILGSQSLPAVKSAAIKFINTVVPEPGTSDVQVGIWWFDGAASLHSLVPFTSSRTTLTNAIQSVDGSMSNDNSTNLYGALVAGIDSALKRASADRANKVTSIGSVVLFTDGTDQAARVSQATATAKVTASSDVVDIYTIGLGKEVNAGVLAELGTAGYFQATDPNGLTETFGLAAQRVKNTANSYYQLQYCSPKRAGTHSLRIEAAFENARGSLSTTFSADGFTGGCTTG